MTTVEVQTQSFDTCKFHVTSTPEGEMGGELAEYGLYELYGCRHKGVVSSVGARKDYIIDGRRNLLEIVVFKLTECGVDSESHAQAIRGRVEHAIVRCKTCPMYQKAG